MRESAACHARLQPSRKAPVDPAPLVWQVCLAIAEPTRPTLLLLSSAIDIDAAPVDLGTIERGLGRLALFGGGHLHKGETLGPAGVALADQVDGHHLAVRGERFLKRLFGGAIGKVANVESCRAHEILH